MKHQNNGNCPKCKEIFDKYPRFEKQLRGWFVLFQAKHPEAHISCAGRGYQEQMDKLKAGVSRASYGKSAHNYNCAIDVFVQLPQTDIYDKKWFKTVLEPEIPYFLNWYGGNVDTEWDFPHIQFREWHRLVATGEAILVEPKLPEGV